MRKLNFNFAECILNLHESERRKPKNWIPIAWLPIYDEEKARKRPTQGYESVSARNMRLYHDCWRNILGKWNEKTQHARKVVFAGEVCHQTRSFVGGLLGDQQVICIIGIIRIICIIGIIRKKRIICIIRVICFICVLFQEKDRMSAEGSRVCHRCSASQGGFLSEEIRSIKTMDARRRKISTVASGIDLPDLLRGATAEKIVDWGEDGSTHRPGPMAEHYEAGRQRCGAHLVFNAFWLIPHFCVHQMLMRDAMHAIDLGVIITLIRAILQAFLETVELVLDIEGRAVAKLEARFRNILARRTGPDGQR
jgi:hypothetical protein